MAKHSMGVGLLGYGNIGREVFAYYRGGKDGARVVRVARRNLNAEAPSSVRSLLAPSADALVRDPAVQLVIDITGDARNGARLMLDALGRGKHVVTANKEALATRWPDLVTKAAQNHVSLGFEATVGGGMPIVRTMLRHIAGDRVDGFAGILNGTCNFILTQMKEFTLEHLNDPQIQKRALPLELALVQAQQLGYAEPDPTKDINGFDTKFKVAILASLAFGGHVDPRAIPCEGILQRDQRIMPSDLYYLQHPAYLGGRYELKLVGVASRNGGKPALRVHPALIDVSGGLADLAAVRDSFNGILIRSKRLGTQFIKGLGAGPKPTTMSIASDVREIASGAAAPRLGTKPVALGDVAAVQSRGFIRSFSPDVKGIYAKKLEILARHKVSVQSIVNVREFVYGNDRSMPDYVEIDPAPDGAVQAVLRDFRKLRGVRDPMYFRVLEL